MSLTKLDIPSDPGCDPKHEMKMLRFICDEIKKKALKRGWISYKQRDLLLLNGEQIPNGTKITAGTVRVKKNVDSSILKQAKLDGFITPAQAKILERMGIPRPNCPIKEVSTMSIVESIQRFGKLHGWISSKQAQVLKRHGIEMPEAVKVRE